MKPVHRNKPDNDPVRGHHDANSKTGKSHVRKRLPGIGPTNVDSSHLWKKRVRVATTQIAPDNQRGSYFNIRGLLDIEIPGCQIHTPDQALFQMTVTNTHGSGVIHLQPPWTWFDYIDVLPNGGSAEITHYGIDIMEWILSVDDETLAENASLCHFVSNRSELAPTLDAGNTLVQLNATVATTAAALPIAEENYYAKRRFADPLPTLTLEAGHSVTVYIPMEIFLFKGKVFYPSLQVRPRLRIYFNASDSIFTVDSQIGIPPWNTSPWTSYGEARTYLDTSAFNLLLSGLIYDGTALNDMAAIYNNSFTFPCLAPQRMILNFTGAGTLASPEDSAYQTLTSINGMFAWIRYYLRAQGAETTAGQFLDFYEIVRTTTRNSGGQTIGYEKIPGQINCFGLTRRCKSSFEQSLSEKINNYVLDKSAALTTGAGNNIAAGSAISLGAPRILMDAYADDLDLAKQGISDGAENFDGNFTLQLAPGKSPYSAGAQPTSVAFTLHIHGQRYVSVTQTSDGQFIIIKH